MSEYRYVIQYPDGSCLFLAEEGPRKEPKLFLQQLREEGFHYGEEHQMGENMLRVLKRDVTPESYHGAAVVTDPYSGRKSEE